MRAVDCRPERCSAQGFAHFFASPLLYHRMAAADEPVKIEHKLCITGGGCPRVPWMISNTITLDGVLFITLKKSDAGFNRFLSGTSRGNMQNWQKSEGIYTR